MKLNEIKKTNGDINLEGLYNIRQYFFSIYANSG